MDTSRLGTAAMKEHLIEYRAALVSARQESISSFDKTLLTLSGGGLTLSVAFVEHFVAENPERPEYLFWAWMCWVISMTVTLVSFYISHLAMTKTIKQVDEEVIDEQVPGRPWTHVLHVLNPLSLLAFVVGLLLIFLFVYANMEVSNDKSRPSNAEATSSTGSTAISRDAA